MTRTDYRLFAALALSTLLHLLAVVPGLLPQAASPPPPPPPIQAELRPPPPVATVAPPPPLTLPEPAPQAAAPASKSLPATRRPPSAPQTWTQAVRQQLQKLDAAGQFYPAEAIARGLEGEVQVLLVIDENGQEVPRGAQGEEISRGPHMFVGYLNERDRTDRADDHRAPEQRLGQGEVEELPRQRPGEHQQGEEQTQPGMSRIEPQ